MDSTTIIMIASFLLVLVVTGMIAFMVFGAKDRRQKRILNVIKGDNIKADMQRKSAQDIRREALAKKLKETSEEEAKNKKGPRLSDSIMRAGLSISVRQYWLYSAAFAAVMTFLVFLLGKGPFVILMTLIISFLGIPKLALKHMAMRRQKQFLESLADVLESMVRLLKAGMPVSEAIKMVSREFSGPIGEEMGRVFDQQKIGVPLSEAVRDCAHRMPLTEVQMFATAVTIQAQTGSSLSEVFDNLARLVRARSRLKRKVQALSSEAKASSIIIASLPIFVATAMYFINPDYIGLLFETPIGKIMLAGAIFWMGMGILVMKQMINFKI